MGGKTKQSQRTKNNVRPSSSSRSADLLNNGITLDSGLVSLSSGSPLPALFPTLAATNLEQGLNPEFQMCIKKLNKKDPITKTKALQELCELVKNGNVEDVVAVLPSWAHFYKTLTSDTDRKVREMTQACHGAVVRVCGRRTAPQLKALLPAWLQAQYDEHAPAQTQASLSLTSTFPDSKLPEVISFCKAEVMSHLLDNLIGNTEAVITKKIGDPEERELQLNRIIISSLQGLEYFTLNLPAVHDEWLWIELTRLLQAKAFWKYSQSTPQVRGAWYGATGRVMERYKQTFGAAYGTRTLRLLLQAAGEHNALLAAQLWTCLLQLMHNIQDWHTYLEKKDLLVKRILNVLENGGWGDARHLTNVLLPLLAYLPKEILTKDFYESFFKAVFDGLEKKNILNSKSERQSWITSLAECLRYLSIQQDDFVHEIATSVHRTWLEKVLSTVHDAQTRNNLIKCSATQMTSLVKYWLKQSKEENSEKYDQLVRNFWQNVCSTVLTQIDKCSTDQQEISQMIEGHILLLQTLKTTFGHEAKKQQSIKFIVDEQPAPEQSIKFIGDEQPAPEQSIKFIGDEQPAPEQSIKFIGDEQPAPEQCAAVAGQCDPTIADRYKHNLQEVVHTICSHYFDNAKQKEISSAILTPLITLLVEFDSQNLFIAIARQFQVDSVYKFYETVLRTWLSNDTMRCKAVVDIVFLLIKYMSEEEQDSAFDTFKQFPPAVVEWCMSVCVCHPHVASRAAQRWLRGDLVAATVRALAGRATRGDGDAARLLRACLGDAPDGEPLVSEFGTSEVVRTLSLAVAQVDSDSLEASAALAAQLAPALLQRSAWQTGAQLVLALFRLSVLVPRGDGRLAPAAAARARGAWRAGARALPAAPRRAFLHAAAAVLREQLFLNMDSLNITKIEDIVFPCSFNWLYDADAGEPEDVSDIVSFTKLLLDMEDPEAPFVEACALRHECVTSQLNCIFEDDNEAMQMLVRESAKSDIKELTKTDLIPFVNKYLFRALYLRALLVHRTGHDDEEDIKKQNNWCNVLLKNEYIEQEFYKVLYHYIIIHSLYEGYAFWCHHDIIKQTKEKLTCVLRDVSNASSLDLITHNAAALARRAHTEGYFWAFARNLFEAGSKQQLLFDDHNTLQGTVSGNGFYHSLQAAVKRAPEGSAALAARQAVMLRSWQCAWGARAGLGPPLTPGAPEPPLDVVVNAYYTHNDTMLYEIDISDVPWSAVVSNVAVVELLADMVATQGWDMPAHHWDFTTITLCSLLSSLEKSKGNWGSTKVSMLARSVLRLFARVKTFVSELPRECTRRQPAPHVAALPREWCDMFAPDTHYNLLTVLMHVLDSCTESEMTSNQIQVVGELMSCVKLVEWDLLAAAHRRGPLALPALARCGASALQRAPHGAYKLLAYCLLATLCKPLVLEDAEKLALWSEDSLGDGDEEKERPQFALDIFHDAFTHLQETVEKAICRVICGVMTCEVQPPSPSYAPALGWLLLAELLHRLCRLARGDLVHHYIQLYRQRQYAEPLLRAALRLLPPDVFALAADNGPLGAPHHYDMFTNFLDFSVHQAPSAWDIGALACRCVYSTVCGPGVGAVRGWWSAANAKEARLLERLVQLYVTPHAADEQLKTLHQRAGEIEDTEVRISWSSHEVTCVYNVEERYIELHVFLMKSHPLSPPRLQAPDSSGPGGNTHWVAMYLAYQNGTILNAIKMWTRAVSAKVESSPQCYICYCRMHPNTGRLPRVTCHQCKNKFHNICLRKWFSTSNKSNCPLCRTSF